MDGRPDKTRKSGAKNPEGGQVSPLGWAILYFREEQGLTRAHLAEQAVIDEDRILEIETGKTRSLQAKTLKAIANGLGLSPDDLRAKEKEFAAGEQSPATTCSSAPNVAPIGIMHNDIRPVPGFTGRENLLADIDAALWQNGGTAALTNSGAHAAAVKGLGGVGKSVLAREYAWRVRERYCGVWWVRAETQQTLIDDLLDLGSRLIPDLKEVHEQGRALHLTLDAIATAGRDKPWLIVYDNVEKPGAIAKLTPKTGAHMLITSRWPRWQGHAQELPVDVFPEPTAVAFLLTERPHETGEAAGQLAMVLGYLPLALSHARAYCAETNLGFHDYGRRLSELIQGAPEDAEYPTSVFATFSLAIAKPAEACPESETLMEIAAFLAPERIPLDLIMAVMSEEQMERAVAALFKASLVTHDTLADGSRAISVHRLIQRVARARLGSRLQSAVKLVVTAVCASLGAVLRGQKAFEHARILMPHIDAFQRATFQYLPAETNLSNIFTDEELNVLNGALDISLQIEHIQQDVVRVANKAISEADEFRATGERTKAVDNLQGLFDVCERLLGSNHPTTEAVRHLKETHHV